MRGSDHSDPDRGFDVEQSTGGSTQRIHRLLLALHPAAYRSEYGPAVEEMLARRREEAAGRGAPGRLRFFVRESGGLIASLWRERFADAPGSRPRPGLQRNGRRGGSVMEAMLRETAHALRRLARSPGFTAAAVLTLALAIGATATVFTLVEGIILSPLPYANAERLVYLDHGAHGLDRPSGLGMTTGLYWQYAHRARLLQDVAIYQDIELTATGEEGPYNVQVIRATPALARALGVAPALGRWFDADEGSPGGEAVAVLSHGYWQRHFGGSPDVLGQSLTLSGRTYRVVGVMPRGFAFPEPETELWIAHQLDLTNVRVGGFNYSGIARLADGVTIDGARAELDRLIAQIPQDFPGDESAVPMVEQARTFSNVQPLKERVVGSTARTLWILFGAVSIVLAVACANVANLFMVRAEARQREVAVRRALGAGRAGIAWFYLAETMLLALAGGAIGLLLAFGGVKLLVAFGPPDLPRLHELGVDVTVLLFTLAVSVGAAMVLGAVTLLRRRAALASWLHEAGRANTAAGVRLRTRSLLMATQIALALVLLVASTLLARSFQRMRAVDPGYDPENALLVQPGQLFTGDYPTREAAVAFHERLLERVRALPGVRAAAATTCPPLTSYCYGDPVSLPGKPWDEGEMGPIASFRRVSDDYFSMMGIRLLRGRSFEERDQRVPTRAAIVDERLAALYFPGESALGKQILISDQTEAPYEIVGVVDHVLTWGVTSPDRPPQVYLPLLSHTGEGTPGVHEMAFIVRTTNPPVDLVPAFRNALSEIDPSVPLALVTTLERMLAEDRAPMAFTMTLIGIASAVALLLSLIGVYGVVSYLVARRSSEIGVRLALGARPGEVDGMILWQGGRAMAIGLIAGLLVAIGISRVIESILFQVDPTDPATYTAVTLTLLAIALLACWIPARRAARLDPVAALRTE